MKLSPRRVSLIAGAGVVGLLYLASGGLTSGQAGAQAGGRADAWSRAGAAAGGSTPAAKQLEQATLAAMATEAGLVTTSTQHQGQNSLRMVTASGRAKGTQSVEVRIGSTTGTVQAVLVNATVYLRGNAFGLRDFMGFTVAAASAEANHWVRVRSVPGEPKAERLLYGTASDALTISTLERDIDLPAPVSLVPPATVLGQAVTGIATNVTIPGEANTHVVLYVRASGKPLPVEELATQNGNTSTAVFGSWGKVPVVSVPAGAVQFQAKWAPNG